jgi:AbiTii
MTLLEEIQSLAVDSSTDVAALLRKCKLLAARLQTIELEQWVTYEANGYPDGVPVPDYRTWSVQLKGHFAGPLGASISNAPIPFAVLPPEVRKKYHDYECRQSIASIEGLMGTNKNGVLSVVTGDMAMFLGNKVYRGYNCVQAWGEFGTMALIEVVNSVRNRVLDFAIELWKLDPKAGELGLQQSTVGTQRMTQIFNTTVYGGSANLVGAAESSTVTFHIGARDMESLRAVLAANAVHESDIQELEAALSSDCEPSAASQYGPKVTAWIAGMMSKAASGGWAIGLGAAGNLLANAIAKYYGLPTG